MSSTRQQTRQTTIDPRYEVQSRGQAVQKEEVEAGATVISSGPFASVSAVYQRLLMHNRGRVQRRSGYAILSLVVHLHDPMHDDQQGTISSLARVLYTLFEDAYSACRVATRQTFVRCVTVFNRS